MPISASAPYFDILSAQFSDLSAPERDALACFAAAMRVGQGTLLLGAGVSLDSGIPGGHDLVAHFQERLDSPLSSLRELCTLFEHTMGRYALQHRLCELLDDWNKPLSPIHIIVARAYSVHTIITTNVDTRLEEACRQLRRPYQSVVFPGDLAYFRSDYLRILKIHGTLDIPDTFVFSDQGYKRLNEQSGDFKSALRERFREHLILSVGYSGLEDPDFDELTAWMAEAVEGKSVLSLQLDAEQADRCRRAEVQPILIQGESLSHAKHRIAQLLGIIVGVPIDQVPQKMARVDRRHNPFRQFDSYRHEDAHNFVGREAAADEVSAALLGHKNLVLFGDSAVGKTSFLHAALVPHLQANGRRVTVETVDHDLFSQWDALLRLIPTSEPHTLILDQFERLFFPTVEAKARDSFLRYSIRRATEHYPQLQCLFVIRRESLPALHRYKEVLPGLYHECVELRPLCAALGVTILKRHFANSGYDLDASLLSWLVDVSLVDGELFLPALQLHGHAQFEHLETVRQQGPLPTVIGREYSISRQDVLRDFIDQALQPFLGDELHAVYLRVLRRLTRHSRRQQLTRAQIIQEFPDADAVSVVLYSLLGRRLVRYVSDRDSYELVHDTLVDLLESGPLALDPDYAVADIRSYLLDGDKRQRTTTDQRRGFLQFSLRHRLPIIPWLSLLSQVGIDGGALLIELCQHHDPALATAAMRFLRGRLAKFGLSSECRTDLSRYLWVVLREAFDEKEDSDKARAAAQLLIDVGFEKGDLEELIQFVDPICGKHLFDELPDIRVLTDFDRQLIELLTPTIRRAISDEQLRAFATHVFMHERANLGPVLYAEILQELAERGLHDELLLRCSTLSSEIVAEDLRDIECEAVLLCLSHVDTDLEPISEFDEIRRTVIVPVLYGQHSGLLIPQVLRLMRQLARRWPLEVIRHWLETFLRWRAGDEGWTLWRSLAVDIISAHPAALRPLLDRLSIVYPSYEQQLLCDVVLRLKPHDGFRDLTSDYNGPLERALLDGLAAQHMPFSVGADSKCTWVPTCSPMALWRAGQHVSEQQERSTHERWEATLELGFLALRHAAEVCGEWPRASATSLDPNSPSSLMPVIQRLELHADETHHQYYSTTREQLALALKELADLVPRTGRADSIDRLLHWLSIVLLTTPYLQCPHPYWPPLGRGPEQFPALIKVIDCVGAILSDRSIRQQRFRRQCGIVKQAYDNWCSASRMDICGFVAVYHWMLGKAAALAAEDGHAQYHDWFQELKLINEAGYSFGMPYGRSCLQWAFQCNWDTPPFSLFSSHGTAEDVIDERNAVWLLEIAASYEPEAASSSIRDWLGPFLPTAHDCAGFFAEPDVGIAFEKLCSTRWIFVIVPHFRDQDITQLFDDPVDAFVRSGLLLWAESEHADLFEQVVSYATGERKVFREPAVAALERWFERGTQHVE